MQSITKYSEVNTFLEYLIQKAKNQINPKKIILFGSRARGDAFQFSDIDVAFEFDELSYLNQWPNFWADMDYDAPILLKLDLVNLNEAQAELKNNILKDGKVIYSR